MYKLEQKQGFIVVDGSDIISDTEAIEVYKTVKQLLGESDSPKLLVDIQGVNLKQSKFDGFINQLAHIEVDKIALLLEELVGKFKFNLWSRKYRPEIKIKQFTNLTEAETWLVKN